MRTIYCLEPPRYWSDGELNRGLKQHFKEALWNLEEWRLPRCVRRNEFCEPSIIGLKQHSMNHTYEKKKNVKQNYKFHFNVCFVPGLRGKLVPTF